VEFKDDSCPRINTTGVYDRIRNTKIDSKARTAIDNSKGIWEGYSDNMLHFDFNLKTAKGAGANRVDPDTDGASDLNLPKLFRRQIGHEEKMQERQMDRLSNI
jgi:hypothetical protein